jgi:uracil-DNA glycosylase family 4
MSASCPSIRPARPDHEAFASLTSLVADCRLCPRMEGRTRVLGHQNGPLIARALFVAEAPGRLGADRLAVPLAGDRTGRTFDLLLGAASMAREEVFITNAVLCNPRDARGNNARPLAAEMANCRDHLAAVLRIVQPEWVVALGAVALHALNLIEPHGLQLRRDVGRPVRWGSGFLVPLYHPGPRALIHRSLDAQRADYRRLGQLLRQPLRSLQPTSGTQVLEEGSDLPSREPRIDLGVERVHGHGPDAQAYFTRHPRL